MLHDQTAMLQDQWHKGHTAMEGMYKNLTTSDPQEELMQKIVEDDFSSNKWRCLMHPDRAVETLTEYAKLEVTVLLAKNLPPREAWTSQGQVPDAAIEVFLNDCKRDDFRTPCVTSRNPVWNCQGTIPILAPDSMVRFQVIDDQIIKQNETGFVEFCVGDIPYDKEISGLFELRLQDNLKLTSESRYASHKQVREDEAFYFTEEMLDSKVLERGGTGLTVSKDELKARTLTARRAIGKARTLFHACAHGCNNTSSWGKGKPKITQAQLQNETERTNAGEVYLTLKLTKVVGNFSAAFANSLPPPEPHHYGQLDLSGDQEDEEAAAKTSGKADNLQEVLDLVTEVKQVIMFDFVWCLYYYFLYIITWREPLLSFPLMACCVAVCAEPEILLWSMFPGMLSIMLIANQCTAVRMEMTRGGANAAFSDDGFKRVAKWMRTGEMYKYIERLVQDDLHGEITEPVKLRVVASHVFRDGAPRMSLAELRLLLRSLKDCISDSNNPGLVKGDLVLVDERYLAQVTSHKNVEDGDVSVEYVKARLDDPAAVALDPSGYRAAVDYLRLRKRPTIHRTAEFLMPGAIRKIIVNNYPLLVTLKESFIPLITKITDIVTWRQYCTALGITIALLLVTTFFTVAAGIEMNLLGLDHSVPISPWLHLSIGDLMWWNLKVQQTFENVICGVLFLFIFVAKARWWKFFSSTAKICFRSCCHRRSAPGGWAFFSRDEDVKARIDGGRLPPPVKPLDKFKLSVNDIKSRFHDQTNAMQAQFQDVQSKLPAPPQLPKLWEARQAEAGESNALSSRTLLGGGGGG